ncbi:SAM-dependent methyltransferase [Ottowia testudinis]|uniref:SAM-dependent methyltransferase n=1 Tax=Ottowia testudinis TaxID=2816950 RepID=A0A975CD71_9BURK|nr:SAM-dependent methyltransferase [Ottowia testudinis]QTD43566.1 SAM-dependent methyltransferase [Ottowia testudinis]
MSSTSWADAPTPVLATEQFPRILVGVIAAEPHDRSVLRIFGIPGSAGSDAAHNPSPRPQIALKLYERLIQAVLASGVVYSLRTVRVADDFYIEYVREQRALWLKYQQILGSRLLIQMTEEQAELFEKKARQLRVPEPAEEAEIDTSSLQGEMALLRAKGQRIELPARRLQHYARIKALILAAGGVYTRNGFQFGAAIDVKAVLTRLRGGEKPNPKKARQAFFTPEDLAAETVAWAAEYLGDLAGKRMLEPSAGEGALAEPARAAGAKVLAVENHGPSAQILRDKGFEVVERDFLSLSLADVGLFDGVIANPPFTKDQDITHVIHMWRFLRPGGVLVSLTSPGWRTGRTKAQRNFRAFVDNIGAEVKALPAGAFKASGTNVSVLRLRAVKSVDGAPAGRQAGRKA